MNPGVSGAYDWSRFSRLTTDLNSQPHTYEAQLVMLYDVDLTVLSRSALRKLAAKWTGQKQPGNLSNQGYIKILEDTRLRMTTFKFLGLPREMRNQIYSELLTLRHHSGGRRGMSCYPVILRANKQILEEATKVLYGENTPDVEFRQEDLVSLNQHRSNRVPAQCVRISYVAIEKFSWPKGKSLFPKSALPSSLPTLDVWPQQLARFRNLRIKIVFGHDIALVEFNRGLYRFVMSMIASKTMKTITLDLDAASADGWTTTTLEKVLWPIALLSLKNQLVFTGIPSAVMANMMTKLTLLEPVSIEQDLLVHTADLRARADVLIKLWQELDGLHHKMTSDLRSSISKVQRYLLDIEEMRSSRNIIRPVEHVMFVETVRLLDAFFQGPAPGRIRSTALSKVKAINYLLAC